MTIHTNVLGEGETAKRSSSLFPRRDGPRVPYAVFHSPEIDASFSTSRSAQVSGPPITLTACAGYAAVLTAAVIASQATSRKPGNG